LDWRNILVSRQSARVTHRTRRRHGRSYAVSPGLSPVTAKPLTTTRDAGNLSSNGGLVVLREAARHLDLAAVVADPLPDRRNPLFVIHSYQAMVAARMMAIAAGYEDADDLDALRDDPALMIACDRAPETGRNIPSQPTISRLENLADTRTLYRIGTGFIDLFCRSYARPPASIVLDIDDTDDMVHGQQELALFNTHAGGTCFQPIHIFEAGSGKPALSLLRPGKRPSGEEIARVLAHVIHRIRRRWPQVAILVRAMATTARRKCLICCARSAATTYWDYHGTRRSVRCPSPGASSADGAGSRASARCAASINSSMRRNPGRARRR
jgi:hypothetical protein